MPVYYWDTSALAKRYLAEKGTPRVLEIAGTGHSITVSRMAMVEVISASVRRARSGELDAELFREIKAAVEEDFRDFFVVVELSRATVLRAVSLVDGHALRAADGIQLASALIAAGSSTDPGELVFVSSDQELNVAARAEGLAVLDPQLD